MTEFGSILPVAVKSSLELINVILYLLETPPCDFVVSTTTFLTPFVGEYHKLISGKHPRCKGNLRILRSGVLVVRKVESYVFHPDVESRTVSRIVRIIGRRNGCGDNLVYSCQVQQPLHPQLTGKYPRLAPVHLP